MKQAQLTENGKVKETHSAELVVFKACGKFKADNAEGRPDLMGRMEGTPTLACYWNPANLVSSK